jgi:hypothetical protein
MMHCLLVANGVAQKVDGATVVAKVVNKAVGAMVVAKEAENLADKEVGDKVANPAYKEAGVVVKEAENPAVKEANGAVIRVKEAGKLDRAVDKVVSKEADKEVGDKVANPAYKEAGVVAAQEVGTVDGIALVGEH